MSSAKLHRALVLTRAWAAEPQLAAHGVFKRLDLFMAALDSLFDAIDMVVFAPWGRDLEQTGRAFEKHFQERWSKNLSVTVCARDSNPEHWSNFDRYLKPAFDVDKQDGYRNIVGRAHVEAIQARLAASPDLIFVHRLHCFGPLLRVRRELPPIVFDMDDVEHVALARQVVTNPAWPTERLRVLHVPALMRREWQAMRLSAMTFVCSDEDAARLRRIAPQAAVRCVPNALEWPQHVRPSASKGPVVGFVGSFDHPPNVDSARLLVTEIWPKLKRRVQNVRLRIVGKGSDSFLAGLGSPPGIYAVGFLPDLRAFYDEVRVLCAPIRFGSGTRVKFVEAAAYGLPVVTTRLGAEGLAFEHGKSILIAEDISDLAEACCQVLCDDELANKLGEKARELGGRLYEKKTVIQAITSAISVGMQIETRVD